MATPVNINTATVEDLMTIKEIGQKRAKLIEAERTKLGTLNLETLKSIEGVPSNLWDPLVLTGRVVFEEPQQKEPVPIQQTEKTVAEGGDREGTKQQEETEKLQKIVQELRTKLLIAEQEKKAAQQDVKKEVSTIKESYEKQLEAKAEEIEELMENIQRTKDKMQLELQYIKSEETKQRENLEQYIQKQSQQHRDELTKLHDQMQSNQLVREQEFELTLQNMNKERKMLMEKVEEQAGGLDDGQEKIKRLQQEIQDKDKLHNTRLSKLEEELEQMKFNKLTQATSNLAPDNIYRPKSLLQKDDFFTKTLIKGNNLDTDKNRETTTTTPKGDNQDTDRSRETATYNTKNGGRTEEYTMYRYRNDGPLPPKLSTFDGKSEWKPYYLQFIHIANKYNWDTQQRLDKLIECLRDKALKFYSTRPASIQNDFKQLSEKFNQRFGNKDLPYTIRRQLQDVRQNVDESIDEFAERVQEMATDGYIDTPEKVVDTISVDAFLKGCTDKKAALLAMEKSPVRIDEALQYVKSSIHNQRVLLGYKKTDVRRVQFEKSDYEDSDSDPEVTVRAVNRNVNRKSNYTPWQETIEGRLQKTEQDITGIKSNVSKILKILTEQKPADGRRYRSPSPNRSRSPSKGVICYTCNQEGHYSNQCEKNTRNLSPARRNRSPSPAEVKQKLQLNEQGSKT